MVLYWYITIFYLLKHQNHAPAVELNLFFFFITPLLQCTSINRCALFMRANIYIYILNFSLLFHLKNILFLSFSLSGFSSFFLFPSHFFFSPSSILFALTICFTTASPPPHCQPMLQTLTVNPFCPYLVAFFFFFSLLWVMV